MRNPGESPYRFGAFELDVGQRQLRKDGVPLPLRARPFDLLTVLASRAGRLISKDELLEHAWPGVIVEENNLQVQVSVLRRILGADSIVTVPGWGYRFALAVQGVNDGAPSAPSGPRRSPPPPGKLFGRDEDVARLRDLLTAERLVTVLGAGGIGKTRLAHAVGHAAAPAFEGGVSWADLGEVREAALVPNQIAASLGLAPSGAQPTPRDLARALSAGRQLLILDNVEHLLAAAAAVVRDLLSLAPALHILVTSQAPLHNRAERRYRLGPLAIPPAAADLRQALGSGAVAMLVDRVRRVDRNFSLGEKDVRPSRDLCRRLDGIPLAIELAAARVPVLGLARLAAQLDERFEVLRGGVGEVPTRQQTLWAVLDWSHQLLSSDDQKVFRRLGAFAGSFSLDQARDLASSDASETGAFLDHLATLLDRSLITAEGGAEPVYRMPESTRAYALEKLRQSADREALERAMRMYEALGDTAAAAGANASAFAHFVAASDLACLLPEGEARDERELEIALKLGPAVQSVLGPAHPRCESLYRRALDLASRANPGERTFKAIWGYWHFLCMGGRNREAAPLADRIVRMAPLLAGQEYELEAHHAAMTTRDLLGEARLTLESARRVLDLYDRESHHPLAFAFGGHDPGVCAHGQGALALWLVGSPDDALAMAVEGVVLADTMADGYSRAAAQFYAGLVYGCCGRTLDLGHSAARLMQLSDEHGMEMLVSEARLLRGRARYESGEVAAGIREMKEALAALESESDLGFILVHIALLADALVAGGRPLDARPYIDRGFGYAAEGQQELFLPELHRLRGDIALAGGALAEARGHWREAIGKADDQGAVSLALRAATNAARAGGPRDRHELERRLAAFSQGRETRDLEAARHLLRARAAKTRPGPRRAPPKRRSARRGR